jgi:hypothetical protein
MNIHICIYIYMYMCMYVCIYVYIYINMYKAIRMISGGNLEGLDGGGSTMPEGRAELDELIRVPTDRRLFAVQTALERGYTIDEVRAFTNDICIHISVMNTYYIVSLTLQLFEYLFFFGMVDSAYIRPFYSHIYIESSF